MICENCNNRHDGSYASGRFCSPFCARSFSTKNKRSQINKKVSNTLKGFRTVSGGKIKLCDYGCRNEAKYKLKNKKWCCSDDWRKCPSIRNKNSEGLKKSHKNGRTGFPPDAYLKGHEKYRQNLKKQYDYLDFIDKPEAEKRRIVLEDQENRCLICGINDWMNKLITLHLDHIDGNRKNWSRNNLRFICPNCHSQTPTYCRGTNKNITNKQLKNLLLETNFNFSKSLELAGLFPGGYNWNRIKSIAETMCQGDVIR